MFRIGPDQARVFCVCVHLFHFVCEFAVLVHQPSPPDQPSSEAVDSMADLSAGVKNEAVSPPSVRPRPQPSPVRIPLASSRHDMLSLDEFKRPIEDAGGPMQFLSQRVAIAVVVRKSFQRARCGRPESTVSAALVRRRDATRGVGTGPAAVRATVPVRPRAPAGHRWYGRSGS